MLTWNTEEATIRHVLILKEPSDVTPEPHTYLYCKLSGMRHITH